MNIINVLDNEILKDKGREKKQVHSPSSASAIIDNEPKGTCIRQQYYSLKGEPKTNPPDATALYKMRWGSLIHEDFAKMLKQAGMETDPEAEFTFFSDVLAFPIVGHLDNIVTLNGEKTILEFKTTFGKGMTNRESGAKYVPKIEHILQVIAYMGISGLRKAKIITYARDSGYRCENDVEWNQKIWEAIIHRWKELEITIKAGYEPPRDYDRNIQWQCSYCSYQNKCYEGLPAKIEKRKKIK